MNLQNSQNHINLKKHIQNNEDFVDVKQLCIVLDRLRSAHNTGNIFRIAEAVGAAEGYAAKPNFPALELTVTDTAGITRI